MTELSSAVQPAFISTRFHGGVSIVKIKNITEVNVDAITGDVIAVAKESAENKAKEAGEKDKK